MTAYDPASEWVLTGGVRLGYSVTIDLREQRLEC